MSTRRDPAPPAPAHLKLRRIGVDTYRENVAFLARRRPFYRPEDFQALAKIELLADGHRLVTSINIVDDDRLLAPDEIGLAEQAFQQFGLAEGAEIRIRQAPPPASLEAVRAKIRGHTLMQSEIDAIIRDIASSRYSKTEIAAFLIACGGFLTTEEVLSLTRAMAAAGTRLS